MKKIVILLICLLFFYSFNKQKNEISQNPENTSINRLQKSSIRQKKQQKENTEFSIKEKLTNKREQFQELVENELKFNSQQMYENELVFCRLSLEDEFEENHLKSICFNYHIQQEYCLTYKKHCPGNSFSAKEEELLQFLHPMEVLSYLKKREEQEAYQLNPLDPPRRDTAYWERRLEELKILKQRMDL